MAPAALLLVLLFVAPALGQDPKKLKPTPKRPDDDDLSFDLSDALEPTPPGPHERVKPEPKKPGPPGGDFSNTDLEEAAGGRGPGGGARREEPDAEAEGSPQGLVPGVVAAVVAAVVGAVSSFVAYQKRKLCFRESGPAPV